MEPISLSLLLLACGVVLLVGELLLPTHGVLGVAGLACLGGAIGVCFYINHWLGLVLLIVAMLASPFIMHATLNLWQRTPIGRQMMLQPLEVNRPIAAMTIGQIGVAISELRPMGECEFGELRVEAASEHGMIAAGRKVRIVSLTGGRPIVRPLASQ